MSKTKAGTGLIAPIDKSLSLGARGGMGNIPCYFLPKKILTDEHLKKYSLDSKLLVGILISSASSSEAVIETASLINEVGNEYISEIIRKLQEKKEVDLQSV